MQAKEDIAKRRCGSLQVADGWSIEIALYTHYTYIYVHNIYIVIYRGIYTYNVNEGVPRVWSLSDKRARVYRFLLVAAVPISSIYYS